MGQANRARSRSAAASAAIRASTIQAANRPWLVVQAPPSMERHAVEVAAMDIGTPAGGAAAIASAPEFEIGTDGSLTEPGGTGASGAVGDPGRVASGPG